VDIQLILVPYDSARRDWRMGSGPSHLLENGLAEALRADGHGVAHVFVESTEMQPLDSAMDLARQIAGQVSQAERRGAFPVILAGNCIASLGGLAGLESRTAVLWLDAHADFNTPETSPTGFLDGMALAVITGRCMQDESETIGGFEPLQDANIVMLGVRDADAGEQPALQRVHVTQNDTQLAQALAHVAAAELYVHVDLDSIDPSVLVANGFATANGLSREMLQSCLTAAGGTKRVAAVAITAYDPSVDEANAGPGIVAQILRLLVPSTPA
jgi:arginase